MKYNNSIGGDVMKPFWVSEIEENHGEHILYVNPLPEKLCTFDCVFVQLRKEPL
jgi:hypothetical protein